VRAKIGCAPLDAPANFKTPPANREKDAKLMNRYLRRVLFGGLVLCQAAVGRAQSTNPGDLIAQIIIPEAANGFFGKAIGYDGQYLYYAEFAGSVLHRINVPPPGVSNAAGHIDILIQGAPSGIMAISYDAGRDAFWAIGGDGLSMYLMQKTGEATLRFTIDPTTDRPSNCRPRGGFYTENCPSESKINYDATDDTIWYAPDTSERIYHYRTIPDVFGTAQLVDGTPWVDVDFPPNDMSTECGYSIVSGIAVGGSYLFVNVNGCPRYFQYTKTGIKVASYPMNSAPAGDIECDDRSYSSYGVAVLWARDGWTRPNIYAHQQPSLDACRYGGGSGLP